MNNEQIRQIFDVIAGQISVTALNELAEKKQELQTANQQYGLSAQVEANSQYIQASKRIFSDLNGYYVKTISERIEKALK